MKEGGFKGQVLFEITRSKMLAKYSGMEDRMQVMSQGDLLPGGESWGGKNRTWMMWSKNGCSEILG